MSRPQINPTTKATQAIWNDTKKVYEVWDGATTGTLVNVDYDYVSVAYPAATTEVYTFKTGGAAGTTVATVTVEYTDATKNFISTVTKV